MKLYSTHFHPSTPSRGDPLVASQGDRVSQGDRPPVLVKEGFCWPCLFLSWIGLLVLGSWIAALLAGAVSITLTVLTRDVSGAWLVLVGWWIAIALFANDWRRWELGLRGLRQGPSVAGGSREAALLRLLDRQPELIGTRP